MTGCINHSKHSQKHGPRNSEKFMELTYLFYFPVCPSYKVLPSTSVEITANFSGQNCLDSGGQVCLECITSRSPEPTRCLQLYLLSQVAVS